MKQLQEVGDKGGESVGGWQFGGYLNGGDG